MNVLYIDGMQLYSVDCCMGHFTFSNHSGFICRNISISGCVVPFLIVFFFSIVVLTLLYISRSSLP